MRLLVTAKDIQDLEEKSEADVLADTEADFSPEEQEKFGEPATNDPPETDNSIPYKPERGKGNFGTNKRRSAKKVLLYGSPVGLFLIVIVVLIAIFVGNLKAVHFATVLRSAGFATFQLNMRRFFADVEFDKAVFSPDSTGKVEARPDSQLLRRLITGNDARSVTAELGRDGSFNYHLEDGKIKGFDFDGGKERVTFDELSQKLYQQNADSLNFRERMGLRKAVTDEINIRLGERIGTEARSFRNSFWKGFRELTGIRMNPFVDGAREFAGKNPKEAEAAKRTDDVKYQEGGDSVSSGIDKFEEEKDAVDAETKTAIEKGERPKSAELFKRGLDKIGVDSEAFSKKFDEASVPLFVSTLYCIAHDLGRTSDAINTHLEKQAARYGSDTQATAQQIQSGRVSAEAVSATNANYDGTDTTPPGEASPFYVAATSGSIDKSDTASLADAPSVHVSTPLDWFGKADTVFKNLISVGTVNIPVVGNLIDNGLDKGIDSACNVLLNPYVQGAIVVGDVVAAGASEGATAAAEALFKAAAFYGGGHVVGTMIQNYISSLSGGFSGAESGVDRVNAAGVATNYLNAQSDRGVAMGVPETKDEAVQNNVTAMAEMRKQYQSQPWKDRYFAIDNPLSLTGSLAARIPTTFSGWSYTLGSLFNGVASTVSQLANGSLFGKLAFGSIGRNTVYAAASQDFMADADFFGVQQWDWTPAEKNLIQTDPAYSFDQNSAYVEQHPEFEERYAKCYADVLQKDLPDECTSTGSDAMLRQPDAIHWRLYKAHSFVVDQLNQDSSVDNGN